MSRIPTIRLVRSRLVRTAALVGLVVVLGGAAPATQDKYKLTAQGGLAFAEFKGYEDWQNVAVSQTDEDIKVILANPTMIKAYRSGIPGNGKPFPEGSKIAKIIWSQKTNTEAPFKVGVPDMLKTVEFIVKDSKRYPDAGGWGYAQFMVDPATGAYTEKGDPPKRAVDGECYGCHTAVAAKDYIFTAYPKR